MELNVTAQDHPPRSARRKAAISSSAYFRGWSDQSPERVVFGGKKNKVAVFSRLCRSKQGTEMR